MQGSNVIVMPNRAPNPDQEGLSAVWKAVHKLEKDFEEFRGDFKEFTKPSWWSKVLSWVWKERNWSVVVLLGMASGIAAGTQHIAGLFLDQHIDQHIRSAIEPVQTNTQRIGEQANRIEGKLSVLQAQIVTLKYSSSPRGELKTHHDELKDVKNSLAAAPRDTPNFWPTTFQIITLLSRTTFDIEPSKKEEYILDTIVGPGAFNVAPGARILLKNSIENLTFRDAIVRFDPSVRLRNVTFINCVLILPVEQNPSKPIQEIGNTLLSSDLTNVTINAS
jgi:hypothetical protein